jgi:galactose oxidase
LTLKPAHLFCGTRMILLSRQTPPDPARPAEPPRAQTIDTVAAPLNVNLFCAGHAFLPDGRLLVVGGHKADSDGLAQAITYTPAPAGSNAPGSWTPLPPMGPVQGANNEIIPMRRWYPTATSLPDGNVVVTAGSYKIGQSIRHSVIPQVWNDTNKSWSSLDPNSILQLYPRMHVVSSGKVFMSGATIKSFLLDALNTGAWTPVKDRINGVREYAPAVLYDVDKILYIGGGGGQNVPPTAATEIIDLQKTAPAWKPATPMNFPRRQHNATLLPDGTVLVNGGTRGNGGPDPFRKDDTGFNDLRVGQPVHTAEVWNPTPNGGKGTWTLLAAEQVDRCYHATTVLLPDARVLSAGGGEYRPFDSTGDLTPNPPQDSHRSAQIFSPPYLFDKNGALAVRPQITSAPVAVTYNQTFLLTTPQHTQVKKVTWLRLGAVTHSFDQNQRISVLEFQPDSAAGGIQVTAPARPELCPPGHYMMFLIDNAGVPSLSHIVQIRGLSAVPGNAFAAGGASIGRATALSREASPRALPVAEGAGLSYQHRESVYGHKKELAEAAARGTTIVIGITGTCPYGIGACWGGAYEVLNRLKGVRMVNPLPDPDASTAQVYLANERLPDLDQWSQYFHNMVNGSYRLRGFEVTLHGNVERRDRQLFLKAKGKRQEVHLMPLTTDKIQWSREKGSPEPASEDERGAYDKLVAITDGSQVIVTGPLTVTDASYQLHVRQVT